MGASVGTVHNDLEVFRSEHEDDPSLVIGGLDGKRYDPVATAKRAEINRKRQATREANDAAYWEEERIKREAERAEHIATLRAEGFSADFARPTGALDLLRRALAYAEMVTAIPVPEDLSDDDLLNLDEALSLALDEADTRRRQQVSSK